MLATNRATFAIPPSRCRATTNTLALVTYFRSRPPPGLVRFQICIASWRIVIDDITHGCVQVRPPVTYYVTRGVTVWELLAAVPPRCLPLRRRGRRRRRHRRRHRRRCRSRRPRSAGSRRRCGARCFRCNNFERRAYSYIHSKII